MPTRTVVRGDTLEFSVENRIDGSVVPCLGWLPVLEVQRRPWDATLTALTGGDGITGQPTDTSWSIRMPGSLTQTFAERGRQARLYYQLRVTDLSRVVTVETGQLFIDRDGASLTADGWQPSTQDADFNDPSNEGPPEVYDGGDL